MEAIFEKLDSVFMDIVQDLVAPPHRLAIAIVTEEQALVMVTRSVLMLGKAEVILPGCWDATVASGDFEGTVVDRRGMLEDVITLCDALNLNYVVEY